MSLLVLEGSQVCKQSLVSTTAHSPGSITAEKLRGSWNVIVSGWYKDTPLHCCPFLRFLTDSPVTGTQLQFTTVEKTEPWMLGSRERDVFSNAVITLRTSISAGLITCHSYDHFIADKSEQPRNQITCPKPIT